ncbi:hypothetical protein KS2013_1882 [Kangiella sediminilitoris]|uniref:Lipoprotein n=1 Tax=Kangiella sediminilitoris TaxID=1144748 RepID=A0A1B3BCP9_9GAMM|nr:hypothetical protein KS2013_1882 [Kangiella sediminilitoris]
MKDIKVILILSAIALLLASCAGARKGSSAAQCRQAIDTAYKELSFAKSEGFAGTVNYTKAASLLTAAKTNQTFESYDACVENSEKARYYIRESRKG